MHELFPVMGGVALGLLTYRTERTYVRALLVAVFSCALGVTASWINGELAIGWWYVWFDIAQVLATSILTSVLMTAWRHRAWHRLGR